MQISLRFDAILKLLQLGLTITALVILFSLVGETHGTLGQCVSFSIIDAGSVLLPA